MTRDERVQQLLARLQSDFLICDGAMGTTLSAGGRQPGRALELLNIEQPELVKSAHAGYVRAGVDIISTNTFQGSRPALDRHGLGDRIVELNRAGVALAREVAGETVFVAGDIGPTGQVLEPYGDYPVEAAQEAFREQAVVLAEAGADLLIVETFTALEELLAAVAGAVTTGLPVAATMSFDPNGRTAFGVAPPQAAQALTEAGASLVGANCGTISSAEMVGIAEQFQSATGLPLIAQPNAGRPQLTETGTFFPESPETLADSAALLRELGVAIIGGCCGTTAAHLQAVVERLRGDEGKG